MIQTSLSLFFIYHCIDAPIKPKKWGGRIVLFFSWNWGTDKGRWLKRSIAPLTALWITSNQPKKIHLKSSTNLTRINLTPFPWLRQNCIHFFVCFLRSKVSKIIYCQFDYYLICNNRLKELRAACKFWVIFIFTACIFAHSNQYSHKFGKTIPRSFNFCIL